MALPGVKRAGTVKTQQSAVDTKLVAAVLIITFLSGALINRLGNNGGRGNDFGTPGPLPNVQTDVLRWYEATYDTFSEDLKYTAKMARDFVARKAVGGLAVQDACTGLLSISEVETLYLWVRTRKPSFVLQLGSQCGYPAFWLLQALEDNDKGELFVFDSSPRLRDFLSEKYPVRGMERLNFVLGDVKSMLAAVNKPWDLLAVVGPSDSSFTLWYIRELFPSLKPKTPVMVSEVYNPFKVPEFAACLNEVPNGMYVTLGNIHQLTKCMESKALGTDDRETFYSPTMPTGAGIPLLSYLGLCNCASGVYTLSPFQDLYFAQAYSEMRTHALGEEGSGMISMSSPSIFFSHTATTFE